MQHSFLNGLLSWMNRPVSSGESSEEKPIGQSKIDFVAVDFETATTDRMACQVGITVVRDGQIAETETYLIQPPQNKYDTYCSAVHGVNAVMTQDAPTFDVLWQKISPYFQGKVYAHNADFDHDVLLRNLMIYALPIDVSPFECTFKMYGLSLDDLCQAFDMPVNQHHDAGFDSRCCAQFVINHLNGVQPDLTKVVHKPKSNPVARHAKIDKELLVQDLSNADPDNPFYDKKVVITGNFSMDRNELASKLKEMGADVNTAVSKKTNFVLVGDEPGPSKMAKIAQLQEQGYDIKILHDCDVMNILAGKWKEYK